MSDVNVRKKGQPNQNALPRRLTVDERVENGHGAVGDTSVGVDLLEDWKKTRQHTRLDVMK